MNFLKRSTLSVCLTIIIHTANASVAAEIELGGDEEMQCSLSVVGALTSGDSASFVKVLESSGWLGNFYGDVRVCLDSPGGSYVEGVILADIISTNGIGTAIPRDATCVSACAIAFMGGTLLGYDGYHEVHRVLHPKGTLGFHAPQLVVEDRIYSKKEIDRAYRVALESIDKLLELKRKYYFDFPESLLKETIQVPASEMSYVETVVDAARWNIPLHPVTASFDNVNEAFFYACLNFNNRIDDVSINIEFDQNGMGSKIIDIGTGVDGSLELESAAGWRSEALSTCSLNVLENSEVNESIGRASFSGQGEYGTLWPFMFYAPDTKIVEIESSGGVDLSEVRKAFDLR